jgi:hypothetical protein
VPFNVVILVPNNVVIYRGRAFGSAGFSFVWRFGTLFGLPWKGFPDQTDRQTKLPFV